MLVILGRDLVSKFLTQAKQSYTDVIHYVSSKHSNDATIQEFSTEALDTFLLKQKADSETFTLMPSLVIFDHCSLVHDAAYVNILNIGNALNVTTVTYVDQVAQMQVDLLSKMKAIVICKNKQNKSNVENLKMIHSRLLKRKLPLSRFLSIVTKSTIGNTMLVIMNGSLFTLKVSNKVAFHLQEIPPLL